MAQNNKKLTLALALVAAITGAVSGLANRYVAGDLNPQGGAQLGAEALECTQELAAWTEGKGKQVSKATLATYCVAMVAAPDKK